MTMPPLEFRPTMDHDSLEVIRKDWPEPKECVIAFLFRHKGAKPKLSLTVPHAADQLTLDELRQIEAKLTQWAKATSPTPVGGAQEKRCRELAARSVTTDTLTAFVFEVKGALIEAADYIAGSESRIARIKTAMADLDTRLTAAIAAVRGN